MTANRSVFYGLGAWVGQQLTTTACKWWPRDPSTVAPPFDVTKQITSDLAKNPQAVRAGTITQADIDVDDAPAHGGLTKIGPTWPTGSTINSCWIESSKYDALPAGVKPSRVSPGMLCQEYELTTVLYWSGPLANRRFWGFHARITSEQGQNAMVEIFPAGFSLTAQQPPAGTWWLDLSQVAHPIEPGFTQIGVGGAPKEGALFLDSLTAGNLQLSGPKIPPSLGSDLLPRTR